MKRLPVAALGLLLVACGGGEKSSGVATVNGHPDPTLIAAKFGCTGYSADSGQIEIFAATQGSCTVDGDSVSILTFASSSSLDKWRKAATDIAGQTGTDVIGDRFVIEANNADQAATVAARVGGRVE